MILAKLKPKERFLDVRNANTLMISFGIIEEITTQNTVLTLTEQKPSKVRGWTVAKYLSTAKTINVNDACWVNVPLKKA